MFTSQFLVYMVGEKCSNLNGPGVAI